MRHQIIAPSLFLISLALVPSCGSSDTDETDGKGASSSEDGSGGQESGSSGGASSGGSSTSTGAGTGSGGKDASSGGMSNGGQGGMGGADSGATGGSPPVVTGCTYSDWSWGACYDTCNVGQMRDYSRVRTTGIVGGESCELEVKRTEDGCLPQLDCSLQATEGECALESPFCVWDGAACAALGAGETCESLQVSTDCSARIECRWINGVCITPNMAPICSALTTEVDCNCSSSKCSWFQQIGRCLAPK